MITAVLFDSSILRLVALLVARFSLISSRTSESYHRIQGSSSEVCGVTGSGVYDRHVFCGTKRICPISLLALVNGRLSSSFLYPLFWGFNLACIFFLLVCPLDSRRPPKQHRSAGGIGLLITTYLLSFLRLKVLISQSVQRCLDISTRRV